MKTLILALSILIPVLSIAQEKTEPKSPMNEIGLTLGSQPLNGNFSLNMAGVQYKHWVNEYVGWRAMAGLANYHSTGPERTVYSYAPDTIFSRDISDRINMPIIGFGLEAQRKFYKRVYMYAALDVQAGYGWGRSDTVITKQYFVSAENRLSYDYTSIRSQNKDVNVFYLGFTPTVGAKINFNKLSIGLEVSPLQCTYRTLGRAYVPSFASVDLSLGSFMQRWFITYRF